MSWKWQSCVDKTAGAPCFEGHERSAYPPPHGGNLSAAASDDFVRLLARGQGRKIKRFAGFCVEAAGEGG